MKYTIQSGIEKYHKFNKYVLAVATLGLLLASGVSLAMLGKANAATPNWELNAPNAIVFTCGGGNYPHTLNTVSENSTTGDFSGTGTYDPNNSYTWDIDGNVNGDDITFTLVYTGTNSGYTLHGTGAIANDGSVSGNTDGNCQTFAMPAGTATHYCYDVDTSKGTLTAAQIGGNVTGEVNATGCDIGTYFNGSNPGSVNGANIHDANQYGVFVDGNGGDVTVNVTNSEVSNTGHHTGGSFDPNGSQYGLGVYYYGHNTAGAVNGAVSNNDINQYQKGGIAVNGENASASVRNNDVTGLDPVPFIAQNGIQFGYGAIGQVQRNTVNGNSYQGQNWTSTGILVFETGNVKVDNNTVENNQTGVAVEAWCWVAPSANNNKIIGNDVSGAEWGVTVSAYSLGGYSTCDASANNNKVTNNNISSTGGDTGVFVGSAQVWGGTDTPEADNNKVIHNSISGFTTPTDTGSSTTPKVHANVITP